MGPCLRRDPAKLLESLLSFPARLSAGERPLIQKLIGIGGLAGIMGSALLLGSSLANAQTEGALQYPPASVGEDARPPPPAGMVPPTVLPRRLELGVTGSSGPPDVYRFRIHPRTDGAFRFTPPPTPPTAAGN
jgi:hypothetical protein